MQYMLVMTETAEELAKRDNPAEAGAYWGAWSAYAGALAQSGIMISGNASATAKAPDLDAALEWAARSLAALGGAVEVRPVLPPMPPQ